MGSVYHRRWSSHAQSCDDSMLNEVNQLLTSTQSMAQHDAEPIKVGPGGVTDSDMNRVGGNLKLSHICLCYVLVGRYYSQTQ